MNRSKTLIVTSKDDSHADHVITELNETGRGADVIRLNTEDFVGNCRVSFDALDFKISIQDSAREVRGGEIRSVWYRRPIDFALPDEDDQYVKTFVRKQSFAFLRGLYFCCHDGVKWINPLPALHRSCIKMQQLQLAKRIGFNVPDTSITNKPQDVVAFFKSHRKVCTKSLDEPNFVLDGQIYPILTRVVESEEEIWQNWESIERCPTLFQEYVEKQCDVRVIVFENTACAFEIHSQEHPLAVKDFRGVSPHLLGHSYHHLPTGVRQKVLAFVCEQGLRFSAMDLILSNDGRYFFLENNPNGQWLWLEMETGYDLTRHMIEMLF